MKMDPFCAYLGIVGHMIMLLGAKGDNLHLIIALLGECRGAGIASLVQADPQMASKLLVSWLPLS